MKNILLIFSICLLSLYGFAQDYNDAVVYIQSDKETPIYVKMEGQMMPRYSKNYSILHNLAAGPLNIEVQFQQNKYPSQKFILNIQPSAQRSFVLNRVSETKFSLYDLNYEFYLQSGNKLEDDIQTENQIASASKDFVHQNRSAKEQKSLVVSKQSNKDNQIKEKNDVDKLPPFLANAGIGKDKNNKKDKEKINKEKEVKENTETENRFLNFEINNSSESSEGNDKVKCEEAANNEQFNSFAHLIKSGKDEEEQLKFLKKYSTKYCFSTDQVRVIAMNFDSQSSRYEVVKILKKKTVDVENYEQLSVIFQTNFLKNKFVNEIANIK
ncbi:MAG TPA: DUF4476 domain-containing protein [Edaphocola sp.]|nr:DUF4476 domain-containing protein [Edaphocola sp.]